MALHIYSVLTDAFKGEARGISNYIDSPKENGYQSFHVKLLADFGRWQEVHASSRRMVRNSQLGCASSCYDDNIRRWMKKSSPPSATFAVPGQRRRRHIRVVIDGFS